LNKKDQSRTPQKEMPAVAFHHTTHKKNTRRLIKLNHAQKKMSTGSLNHSMQKKMAAGSFFFHHTLKEMAESSFLSRNTNWGS
jgi:hypothetical protein